MFIFVSLLGDISKESGATGKVCATSGATQDIPTFSRDELGADSRY
jgi:hypothetical protein